VPLMKAAELDSANPKIVSNIALFLLANGQPAEAQALMNQQKLALDVRAAIRSDAAKVVAAGRGGARSGATGLPGPQSGMAAPAGTVASTQNTMEPAPRLLQRFAQ